MRWAGVKSKLGQEIEGIQPYAEIQYKLQQNDETLHPFLLQRVSVVHLLIHIFHRLRIA